MSMSKTLLLLSLIAATFLLAAPLLAAAADSAGVIVTGATLEQISKHMPTAKGATLRTTPLKGIYELQRGAELVYVTADGDFAMAGDLYRLSDNANLTAARRNLIRRDLLAAVPESSMLVFAPADVKYTVNVFTDVDCAYCRALHKQMAEYNRLGIRVRYLSYPRTGPNTVSWTKAEQVWCAADRKTALTQAKLGEIPKGPVCAGNPVASQYALGESLRFSGTPAIVTQYGNLIEGYVPPAELLSELQSEARLAAR
jgi:thiol:disulfide interchange protein DsbC